MGDTTIAAVLAPPKLTEADVLALLRERYTKVGNGGSGQFGFLTHVRDAAGFDARRTFDAVTIELWPSRGFAIDVFEVKVTRSDWQKELAEPAKAEAACAVADRFTMVAPSGCIKDGELPMTWGLIEVVGDGSEASPWRLRAKKAAPWLDHGPTPTKDRPLSRPLLVSMLRAVPGAVPGGRNQSASEQEISRAIAKGRELERSLARAEAASQLHHLQCEIEEWQEVREALTAAGVRSYEAGPRSLCQHAAVIAAAIGGAQADRNLTHLRQRLVDAIAEIDVIQPESSDA